MRIIEHSSDAIDLSRTDAGLIRLTIGFRDHEERGRHFDLYPADARALGYALLGAAERDTGGENRFEGADWPEEYWAKGTFPADQLRDESD